MSSLSQMRRARMAAVAKQRIDHVRCAVESVHHRHNVSAILRTCDSLGLSHVHLVAGGHFKPATGAARGAERWLNLHHEPSPEAAIAAIRGAGFRIYVADFDEEGLAPEQIPIDAPVCLWFGAELQGVSPAARAQADGVLTIPMYGMAQSLNVSVAAAVSMRPVVERSRAMPDGALLPEPAQQALIEHWISREEQGVEGSRHRRALLNQKK